MVARLLSWLEPQFLPASRRGENLGESGRVLGGTPFFLASKGNQKDTDHVSSPSLRQTHLLAVRWVDDLGAPWLQLARLARVWERGGSDPCFFTHGCGSNRYPTCSPCKWKQGLKPGGIILTRTHIVTGLCVKCFLQATLYVLHVCSEHPLSKARPLALSEGSVIGNALRWCHSE